MTPPSGYGRPDSPEPSGPAGSSSIGRARGRATFEALRRHGRRVRRGPVSVTYLPSDGPPRAAFAIGRAVGNAVVRNRVRRRLRAALHDINAGRLGEQRLAPGTYLLGVRPDVVALPYSELADLVRSACAAVVDDRAGRS